MIRPLCFVLLVGLLVGSLGVECVKAQEEEAPPETITLPIVYKGVTFLDPSPELSAYFRTKAKDTVPVTSIKAVSKEFDLPLNLDLCGALNLGGVVFADEIFEGSLFGGIAVGGLQRPVAWLCQRVPWVGDKLGVFIGLIDGRVGYGGSVKLGTWETDHGLSIGVIRWEVSF